MIDAKLRRTFLTMVGLMIMALAAPLSASQATLESMTPIAQVTDTPVVVEEDEGFPWGLLGLLGLLGLAGLKGKDDRDRDRTVRVDRTNTGTTGTTPRT